MKQSTKLSLSAVALVFVAVGIYSVWRSQGSSIPVPELASVVTGSESITRTHGLSTTQRGMVPARLAISKIGVNAPVESVGIDRLHNMAVPVEWTDAGWYQYGTLPGAVGNAVMDGHVDNARGKPGVFYNLKNLNVGDTIIVTNASGTPYTYQVTKSNVYSVKGFPSQEVFGTTTKAQLQLITCDGVWVQSQKSYDKRLVVTAELMK